MNARIFAILSICVLLSGSVLADTVNIGASGTAIDNQGGRAVGNGNSMAMQFTLNNATLVTSVSAAISYFRGLANSPYNLLIEDSLTGGTVYWTSPSTSQSNPTYATSFTLGPGTYYLEGPIDPTPVYGSWQGSTGTYTQIGGTFDTTGGYFDNSHVAGWTHESGVPLGFDIQGSSAVPEPSSLLLLSTGALGVLGPIRRKLLPRE